ncbi:MAG: hypothetical protein KF773_33175 [Deltaproteobacteria bacterium]|nr:hypothetical protein [Deltaproteobacteria bacterium]MCW5808721.1 hypothetical protein [Deltaproteobacteria bacterium]
MRKRCPGCRAQLALVEEVRYTDTHADGSRLVGGSTEWRCDRCVRTWWQEGGRLMTPEEHLEYRAAQRGTVIPRAVVVSKKR